MTHHHETFDRAYWENRYSEPGFTWSGNPNAVLVQEASDLIPASPSTSAVVKVGTRSGLPTAAGT